MGSTFLLHQPVQNEILRALSHPDLIAVRPMMKAMRLVPGQLLIEHGQPVDHVHFIEDGVVSLTAEVRGDKAGVQLAMIGKEGIVGGQALLDVDALNLASAVVHIPGSALRMSTRDLQDFTGQSSEFRRLCLAAVAAQMGQIMQNLASHAHDTLETRCALWLLMMQDRVGNELAVTHETISSMLGVRRSSVTVTLTALQEKGLIHVQRARITILDRSGLEHRAGMYLTASAGRRTDRAGVAKSTSHH